MKPSWPVPASIKNFRYAELSSKFLCPNMHTASTTQPFWNDSVRVSITVCTVNDRTKKYNQTAWIFSFFSLLLSLSLSLSLSLRNLTGYCIGCENTSVLKVNHFWVGNARVFSIVTKIGGLSLSHTNNQTSRHHKKNQQHSQSPLLEVRNKYHCPQSFAANEMTKNPAIRGPPSHGFSGDTPAFSPGELMVYWILISLNPIPQHRIVTAFWVHQAIFKK